MRDKLADHEAAMQRIQHDIETRQAERARRAELDRYYRDHPWQDRFATLLGVLALLAFGIVLYAIF